MELFVSAGEASSDIHCAHLIQELKARADISTFGMGGKELAAVGTQLLLDNRELAGAGGPLEVVSQLPKRRGLKRALKRRLDEKRPDGAILVDTGEINLHLAPILRAFRVPTIYFIPPKVWVWRAGRLDTIARNIDLVLSVLPFEEPIYRARSIPFQYVGNPLLDEVPLQLTELEAKARLNIAPDVRVLAVLPGSRQNEIHWHLDLFGATITELLKRVPESEPRPLFLVPAAQAIEPDSLGDALQARVPDASFKIVKEQSHACLKAARAALIKSGTSTLEAALLRIPMVLTYQSSGSTRWVFRNIVRYRGFVGLVNLFLEPDAAAAIGIGEKRAPVVPEMILDRCKPDLIADKLIEIYRDGPERERMLVALARTPSLLSAPPGLGRSPIKAAAAAAWDIFQRRPSIAPAR